MIVAKTRDLGKIYRQGELEVRALAGINLEISQGEFTAIVGPSGSGKTTLLNLLGGLDRSTTGSVVIGDQSLDKLSEADLASLRRDKIGYVFQAYNLIEVFTAAENAAFTLELQEKPKNQIKGVVSKILADLGLADLGDRFPNQLSGGQQQRVAVARAIASSPAIVLADEPTANLDSASAESLLSCMADLNRDLGMTFVFSTHDDRVINKSRRVITLQDGVVSSDKSAEL